MNHTRSRPMKHTIATPSGGRVIVRPSEDRETVVLGINANQGAASVRLDAESLGALLFALEESGTVCGMAEGVAS